MSTSSRWEPEQYLTFADERGRPFFDLMARVPGTAADRVVDLGCGPGNLTVTLAQRWPEAEVLGLDSSVEMIEAARTAQGSASVRWEVADLRDWVRTLAPASVDVLVSNATLQWVPGHLDLLPALVRSLRPGGRLAFQVPGNFSAPSHALRRELADAPRYAAHLVGVEHPDSADPGEYLARLRALGCAVDAWETTYLHVLQGEEAVFDWVRATGARPTLDVLGEVDPGLRDRFAGEFRALLRQAYPVGPDGSVVLAFRRVFVVAQVPDSGAEL